nr:hypothetical protein CFP56_28015 [Quercus suber]
MEQEVVNSLQKLCLTKEEEAEISITAHSRTELLEECSLSLFGRLLLDKRQNQRALKSTLRATWKIGSELRIIEGLPFEVMSEGVGHDIGNSMGRFIEMDKTSKGGSGRPNRFSNGSHSAGSDNQSGGKDQMSEKALQPSPAAQGGECSDNDCIQNSKNAQDSSKTYQMRGCDVKGTSKCQVAGSMVGLDNLDASSRVMSQGGAPRDEESMPIPMETSSTGVLVIQF